jgi:hypothetical protein
VHSSHRRHVIRCAHAQWIEVVHCEARHCSFTCLLCGVVLNRLKLNSLIKNPASFWKPRSDMVFECKNSYCNRNSSAIVWCLWAKCNEWGESLAVIQAIERWPMHDEGQRGPRHPSWMRTLLKKSTKKFVKIFGSQFQSYQRVFHKLNIHYSMKLLQTACTTMKSVQDGCPKWWSLCKMGVQNANAWTKK